MTKNKKKAKKNDEKNKEMSAGGLIEDEARAMRIATDIIEPALQKLLKRAKRKCPVSRDTTRSSELLWRITGRPVRPLCRSSVYVGTRCSYKIT